MAEKRRTDSQKRHDDALAARALGGVNPWAGDQPEATGRTRAADIALSVGAEWAKTLSITVGAGFGLTVSGTRDGGALSFSLLTDKGALKKYAADPDEALELLRKLQDHLGQQF